MRTGVILLTGLMFFISCSKDNDVNKEQPKSPAQLLTQKQWLLTRAGFNDNNNGLVDDGENIIDACQKDNIYTFSNTGSGSIIDNGEVCAPPTPPSEFSWKFLNGDKEVEIGFQKYFIKRLNENELMISPDLPLNGTFIVAYRH